MWWRLSPQFYRPPFGGQFLTFVSFSIPTVSVIGHLRWPPPIRLRGTSPKGKHVTGFSGRFAPLQIQFLCHPYSGGRTPRAVLCAPYEIVALKRFVMPPLAGERWWRQPPKGAAEVIRILMTFFRPILPALTCVSFSLLTLQHPRATSWPSPPQGGARFAAIKRFLSTLHVPFC